MPEVEKITTFKKVNMKKAFLFVSALWLALSGFGQRTMDFGLWGGTSSYFGDMENIKQFQKFNPTGGFFIRYNFNSRVSFRTNLLIGKTTIIGSLFGVPQVDINDKPNSKVLEDLSFQGEVNYLKYLFGDRKTPFTSYVSGGISFMRYPYNVLNSDSLYETREKKLVPALAFGLGIKYNLGKKIAIGAEYQMRKLFKDTYDNTVDPYKGENMKGDLTTYNDLWHNNDWVTFLGLHITYLISVEKKPCPAYNKN